MIDPRTRKRRKIERQLRALHTMQSHLQTWELVCATLSIPALALLCFLVALKLHWVSNSPFMAILGAAASGAAIWWIGRRWFVLAALIVFAMLMILFESADLPYDLADGKPDRKTLRRRKLERAIAKREALLRSLNEQNPRG